jgi:hypothetical protein
MTVLEVKQKSARSQTQTLSETAPKTVRDPQPAIHHVDSESISQII